MLTILKMMSGLCSSYILDFFSLAYDHMALKHYLGHCLFKDSNELPLPCTSMLFIYLGFVIQVFRVDPIITIFRFVVFLCYM